MTHIRVTYLTLGRLRQRCANGASQLRVMTMHLDSCIGEVGNAMGDGPVAGALSQMWTAWRGNLVEIGAVLDGRQPALLSAKDAYRTTDERVVRPVERGDRR